MVLCSYDLSSHIRVFWGQVFISECNLQLQHYFYGENGICFTMTHSTVSFQGQRIEKSDKSDNSLLKLSSPTPPYLLIPHSRPRLSLGTGWINWNKMHLNPIPSGSSFWPGFKVSVIFILRSSFFHSLCSCWA